MAATVSNLMIRTIRSIKFQPAGSWQRRIAWSPILTLTMSQISLLWRVRITVIAWRRLWLFKSLQNKNRRKLRLLLQQRFSIISIQSTKSNSKMRVMTRTHAAIRPSEYNRRLPAGTRFSPVKLLVYMESLRQLNSCRLTGRNHNSRMMLNRRKRKKRAKLTTRMTWGQVMMATMRSQKVTWRTKTK